MEKKGFGLSAKFISMFFCLAIIPTVFIGFFAYRMSYQVLWKQAVNTTEKSVQQLQNVVDNIFVKTEYFSEMAQEDCVREFVQGEEKSYENVKEVLNLMGIYRKNIDLGASVHDMYLIGEAGDVVTWRKGKLSREEIGWLEFQQEEKEVQIFEGDMNPFYDGQRFIYVQIPLIMKSLRDPYGQLILELKSDVLQDFCNETRIADTGYFVIVNALDQVLFAPENGSNQLDDYVAQQIRENGEDSFIYGQGKHALMITYNEIKQTEWMLVGQIPMNNLMADAYQIRNTMVCALAAITVLTILLYVYFSNKFILPLRKLKATMQMASFGDMSVRFEGHSKDEIQELGNSFNFMLERIDLLTKQDLNRQASLQKAELDILQAQINPHFLYNTLDTIIWQAKAGNSENVIETADALASFFRTVLSKGKSWITVREEISMLNSYLTIQKTRYASILEYEMEVDEEILDYKMLKLILQPIVENAIYHGIKEKREGGRLRIFGFGQEDRLIFRIEDNGIGMDGEHLWNLKKQLENQEPSICVSEKGGFGVANVNGRIRLYYGEDYGIQVESVYGKGTVVTISLRKEM